MPPTLRCTSFIPSTSCANQLCRGKISSRSFSTTPRNNQRRITRARRQAFKWLATTGQNFYYPRGDGTNYMGAYTPDGQLRRVVEAKAQQEADSKKGGKEGEKNDAPKRKESEDNEAKEKEPEDDPDEGGSDQGSKQDTSAPLPPETARDWAPFPLNRTFISQPVLSDELREEIWLRVMKDEKTVREVSAEFGVEMRRVGAVVRLKEVEKEWERLGVPLAKPYAQAIMAMLPKTPFDPDPKAKLKPHESINDLPVHRATGVQIFHPTSESRVFTRADAAKVFDEKLLPADDRVPHPELTIMHKEFKAGLSKEERKKLQDARDEAVEKKRAIAIARQARKEAAIKKVDAGRWEFRFTEVNVDDIGKDGRGYNGVGWRYGKPHMDRSKGAVKIPTSVQ